MALMQIDIEAEKKFKEIFRILDINTVGYIKNDELAAVIDRMKEEVGMKDEEVKQLVDDIDKNKDQKIQFNEFYKFMSETEDKETEEKLEQL
ncbi:troponin C, skeletal muscle-like [Gigantopelta aegis]|uniref:troponin C, skeletal muscle-like n=1 Tax=Gigantopelta aegis TaxID=1735272 RepID=UPI001B88C3F7|nr:troponin C, skeletal muscle-like [Gigantopelta aegis]